MDASASRLDRLLKHPVGSHFLEAVISTGSTDSVHSLYVNAFRGQLEDRACHRPANFVLQQLLDKVNKEDTAMIVEELGTGGIIENILAENHGPCLCRVSTWSHTGLPPLSLHHKHTFSILSSALGPSTPLLLGGRVVRVP